MTSGTISTPNNVYKVSEKIALSFLGVVTNKTTQLLPQVHTASSLRETVFLEYTRDSLLLVQLLPVSRMRLL